MALRVGVHPNNLHLFLTKAWPDAFAALDATLVPYAEGRDSAALMDRGQIDVCGTGSTPPILAEAAGLEIAYLAASAPRPANGGILVAPGSSITSAMHLRGARVALLNGSFHTYLLARELDKVGLKLGDVARVELQPGASLLALAAGEVDAWVAMAPLLDQSLATGRTRLLALCGDTIPNRSMFWTLRRLKVPDNLLDGFVAALVQLGRDIASDPARAAAVLAADGAGQVDRRAWREIVAGRDWSIVPAGADIIAEQQIEADTLLAHADLPHPVDLRHALRTQAPHPMMAPARAR